MVEFHVVDLVRSLRLESLEDDGVLLLGDLHAEVVKDGAESSESNEA